MRPEAGLSVPRRAYLSRGGRVRPEAGFSFPRRACPSRGGLIRPEAGLSVPRRACLSRGGPSQDSPEAGLSIPRRAYPQALLQGLGSKVDRKVDLQGYLTKTHPP